MRGEKCLFREFNIRVCAESLLDLSDSSTPSLEVQLRYAQEGPAAGRGWPLFRRLSRSVHGHTTGSEGGRCWSAQMACVRACVRAHVS